MNIKLVSYSLLGAIGFMLATSPTMLASEIESNVKSTKVQDTTVFSSNVTNIGNIPSVNIVSQKEMPKKAEDVKMELVTLIKGMTINDIIKMYSTSIESITYHNNGKSKFVVGDIFEVFPNDYLIDYNQVIADEKARKEELAKQAELREQARIAEEQRLLEEEQRLLEEAQRLEAERLAKELEAKTMVNPASGYLSSAFGWRVLFGSYDNHLGIDIAGSGSIISALKGTVEQAYYAGSYGNMVLVNHGVIDGHEIKTRYGHLDSFAVSVGQTLEKGQQIGIMGTTGNSTGVHLHFEVIVDNVVVNPLNYVTY